MRRLPFRSLAASATALTLLTLAAPSHAAPTWLPPGTLGSTTQTVHEVALNPAGEGVTIGLTPTTPAAVVVSTRSAGGAWGPPTTISAVGQSVDKPDVAIGADGTAAAVWTVASGTSVQVVAAVRPPGGAWTAGELVSGAASTADLPHVGVDGKGTALVVFTDGTRIQATSRPAGGAWSMPTSISGTGTAWRPDLAVADSGHAVATWEHSPDGTNRTISASLRAPGGAWLPPNPLTPPAGSNDAWPSPAVNNQGDVVVAFARPVAGVSTVQAVVRRNGAWSAAETLSTAGVAADTDSAAIGDDGTVVVPFLSNTPAGWLAGAAVRRPDGVWAPAQTLSDTVAAEMPLAGVDARGNAVVAWGGTSGGVPAALTVRRSTGGSWGAAEVRSAPGAPAAAVHLAQSASGDALLGWTAGTAAARRGTVAVLDGAGPSISQVVAPATGAVGRASDFSAVVTDAWSEVASVAWNFSDGAAGTGTAPHHTWTTPGTHEVTVTATDTFGNTSVHTAQVEVSGTVDVTAFKLKPRTLKLRGSHKQTRVKAKITLTSAAKVKITFTPAKSKGKKKPKKKPKVYATLSRHLRGGTSTISITGKVGGKRLKPGKYKLVVSAHTDAGKGRTRKAVLTVVR